MFLSSIVAIAFFQILFALIPIFLIAYFRKNYRYLKPALILFIILLFNQFVLNIFRIFNFAQFYWNWSGKILEALWPLIVVYLFKWMSPKEVGYKLPNNKTAWLWAIALGIIIPIIGLIADSIFGGSAENYPIFETIFFQLSMPGISEEQVFRGIILAVFNRYFTRPWKVFNVPIGWGLIFTTILFTSVHIVNYSSSTKEITWNFTQIIPVFIMGFILGWLREKTSSIWPSVLLHNFSNGFYTIGRLIIAA